LAALASGLFNAAVVLQAIEAREIPSEHWLRLSLVGRLARQPRWLGGIGLSVAAVSLKILAITLAPPTVLQPADAAGLVLLSTVGSQALRKRVARRELISAHVIATRTINTTGPFYGRPEAGGSIGWSETITISRG
jgi:hypothetical protein